MARTPPIDEVELGEYLEDAGIDVDPGVLARMLVTIQPMRAMLRAGGGARRGAILRGAALDAGWAAPGAAAGPVQPPSARLPRVRPEFEPEPTQRATVRSLASRLGAVWLACVLGMFAAMSMIGPNRWVTLAFVAPAAALLYMAVTGRGQGGMGKGGKTPGPIGGVVAIVLLIVTGVGPLLLTFVGMLFHPKAWAQTDFLSRAVQVIGLITLYIIVSHVIRARRARG